MTYAEKLKDPRWQKKRLEIMNRDNWTCQQCHLGIETLHVHHRYYLPGKDPWEYPDTLLVTLCESCHVNEEKDRKEAETAMFYALCKKGLLFGQIISLASVIDAVKEPFYRHPNELLSIIEKLLFDKALREKMLALVQEQQDTSTEDATDLQF